MKQEVSKEEEGYWLLDNNSITKLNNIPKIGKVLSKVFNTQLTISHKDSDLREHMLTTFNVQTIQELGILLNQPISLKTGYKTRLYNILSTTYLGIYPKEDYTKVEEDDSILESKLSTEDLVKKYSEWLIDYQSKYKTMETYLKEKERVSNTEGMLNQVKDLLNK